MIPIKWVGLQGGRSSPIPTFCKRCGKPLKEEHKRHRYEVCNGCKSRGCGRK